MYPNGGVSGYFSPLPPLAFWTRKFSLVRGCPAMIGCSAGPLLPITRCQQCPAPVTTTYTPLHTAGCPGGEKRGSVGTRRAHFRKRDPGLGVMAYKTETHPEIPRLTWWWGSGPGMKTVPGQARVSMRESCLAKEPKTQSS